MSTILICFRYCTRGLGQYKKKKKNNKKRLLVLAKMKWPHSSQALPFITKSSGQKKSGTERQRKMKRRQTALGPWDLGTLGLEDQKDSEYPSFLIGSHLSQQDAAEASNAKLETGTKGVPRKTCSAQLKDQKYVA